MEKNGKFNESASPVHFVGAGSGAADLITVRGARLLESADAVVWAGSLVNPDLLDLCGRDCEIFDSSSMTLAETTEVLARFYGQGKSCVRLHTGDPSLFGAVREQMDLLDEMGIPYDVTPGVSSLFGAAAALEREFTVPGGSQTLIISRIEGRTPVPPAESVESLSTHGSSMAFFLSAGKIGDLCRRIVSGGKFGAETPCAVVYKATWPEQKIVRGNLGDIAEKALDAGIDRTALVLVGDFLERSGRSLLYDEGFSTGFRR